MPQLDPTFYTGQLFWLAVTFVVLYWVLSKAVLPRVANVLEARQNKIDDDLDRAATSKREAESVLAEYEKSLAEGHAAALTMLRQAADDMAAESAKSHGELADKLSDDVKAAEARILEAKKAAVGNINEVAAEVAQAATLRLIGLEVDDKAAAASVKAVAGGKG